ncbi:MAG: DUF975 family protein [Leuconostoc fallax]
MNELEPISIREMKREARDLYRGHWGTAIKLNILPIVAVVGSFFFVSLIMAVVVYSLTQGTINGSEVAGQADTSSDNNSVVFSVISDGIGMLFTWSIEWGIVDWFKQPKADQHFKQSLQIFSNGKFWQSFLLALVQNILIYLWTLLFIIPGIIKTFSYSQTYYAYKRDLDQGKRANSLTDYITTSRRIMDGRKWELFLLELSFIGWYILGFLTAGIGYIWIIPYVTGTRVAYSRRLFGDDQSTQSERIVQERTI